MANYTSSFPGTDIDRSIALVDKINAKAYGAVGNGTTDDTLALQAALDAINTAGGGILFVPKGTYVITDSLVVYSNTIVIGESIAGTIFLSQCETAVNLLRTNTGSSHCAFEKFSINGNKASYESSSGLFLAGSYHTVREVYVYDIKTYDGIIAGSSSSQITIDNCWVIGTNRIGIAVNDNTSYIKITNNYIEATGAGGINIIGGSVSNVLVDHNMTKDTGEDCICGYYPTNTNLVITNNIGINAGNNAIHMGGNKIKVSNNFFYTAAQHGMYFANSDESAATDLQITDNFIEDANGVAGEGIYVYNYTDVQVNNNHIAHNSTQGCYIINSSHFTVNGNNISGNAGNGIRIYNSPYGTISNNSVNSNSSTGVFISDDGTACVEITITGNSIRANGTWGIDATANSNRILAVGNVVLGHTSGQIGLSGAQSVEASNIEA